MKKYILFFAVTLMVITWLSLIPSYVDKSYMAVEAVMVKTTNLIKTIDCKGNVTASNQDTIVLGIPVKISKQNFNIGDEVKKGQKPIEIDEDVAKQTLSYASAFASTNSNVTQSVSSDEAYTLLEQAKSLGIIDENTYDSYKDKIKNSNGKVTIPDSLNIQAASDTITSTGSEALSSLENSLCSKITGIVTSIKDSSYGIVPASTCLATVVDMNSLEVTAKVKEDDLKEIKVGQQAHISGDSFSGTYNGTVKKIGPSVNSSTLIDLGNYVEVIIGIDKPDAKLIPGVSSNVSIKVSDKKNIAAVPFEYIKQDDDGKEYVYVFKKGRAVKTEILTGTDNGDTVEIIKGLKSGDIIVTNSTDNIQNGMKVKLHK